MIMNKVHSKKPLIFLASKSPRRRLLLKRLGLSFRIVSSTARESILKKRSPSQNAIRNAVEKVRRARVKGKSGYVLGADTFIYLHGEIIGKPKNLKDAGRILKKLSGKAHYVYTGLAIRNLQSGKTRASFARSKVRFKRLTQKEILDYVQKWRPLDKAGAYAIQEDGRKLIRSVQGSRSNVVGLPVELLMKELRQCAKESV